ncbi:peptide-methionine (S)-S-oxide reductase [Shewanella sp. JM162201]|uniref:peptide-methionine (S)-S-oxide reductase n=1 Tax=Shewanella jiangmenensis TaxID=2837387 RepID=A0ABS5V4H3_9GAMM|nr:peptide-methionine (S)-S-oxide reductase [Shewanella jiangmenensis]MBT1445362.1 peptide-methionine (S)-S-oxide reductase [Shewanella jiangmenensis]
MSSNTPHASNTSHTAERSVTAAPDAAALAQLTLGGGCHWCTEAVFQSLAGVIKVEQGFAQSTPPYESWSEAVRVSFDPDKISEEQLIRVHLHTHAATKAHSMRGKYRSALYFHNERQQHSLNAALQLLAAEFCKPLITQILPLEGFKASPAEYQNYYHTDPKRPFCRVYIAPKLEKVRLLTEKNAAGHSAQTQQKA